MKICNKLFLLILLASCSSLSEAASENCGTEGESAYFESLKSPFNELKDERKQLVFLEGVSKKGMYSNAADLSELVYINKDNNTLPDFKKYGIDCLLFKEISADTLTKKNWSEIKKEYEDLLLKSEILAPQLIYDKLSYGEYRVGNYQEAVNYAVSGLGLHENEYLYENLFHGLFGLDKHAQVGKIYKSFLENQTGYESSKIISWIAAYSYAELEDFYSVQLVLLKYMDKNENYKDSDFVELIQMLKEKAIEKGYSDDISKWKVIDRKTRKLP